jgi:signal transduction histidine kinase
MSGVARARAWPARHAIASDSLVGLVVLGVALSAFVIGPPRRGDPDLELTPWMLTLTVAASAVLVLRRRRTGAVWIATVTLGLVAMLVSGGPSPAYIPAIVALYTLATLFPLRLTLISSVVTALAPAAILVAQSGFSVDAFVYGLTAWCGLAAVSGIAVRSQRAVVAAAHERARQAEATREEEAQRRVAEERLRIARELHDVVAHHISVINVQAGVAGHLVRSDPDRAVEALGHVREASQIVLSEVPGLLGLLRTADDQLVRSPAPRLADADELVEAARRSGLDVTWRTTGSPVTLAPGADLTAYRVLQEALTNAARHGCGRAVGRVAHDSEGCTLEVRNERRPQDTAAGSERHGLMGMRERVAAVGGELTVGPQGDREWVVRLRLRAQPESVGELP